jgi:diketogulonate reductase-like aldo/keto reductase
VGLADEDWEAWRAMEELQRAGRTRLLGVSNVTLAQLELLVRGAAIPPAMVQNRCYASTGWDRAVRAFCRDHGIAYQAFSLLTANRGAVAHPRVRMIAARLGATPAQVIFRFALAAGMIPLTGTSSAEHMRQDLDAQELELTAAEVAEIETVGGGR